MQFNYPAVFIAALVPLIVGFLWYNMAFGFGKIWIKNTGLSEEELRKGNMPLIFGLTYVFSVLLAFVLQFITIHQFGLMSMLENVPDAMKPETEVGSHYKWMMDNYGSNFRSFKHGALHGFMTSVFVALPVLGINALFERKKAAYILLHWGFWAVVLLIMGGIICAW